MIVFKEKELKNYGVRIFAHLEMARCEGASPNFMLL